VSPRLTWDIATLFKKGKNKKQKNPKTMEHRAEKVKKRKKRNEDFFVVLYGPRASSVLGKSCTAELESLWK
jgi:hypothetical protein